MMGYVSFQEGSLLKTTMSPTKARLKIVSLNLQVEV